MIFQLVSLAKDNVKKGAEILLIFSFSYNTLKFMNIQIESFLTIIFNKNSSHFVLYDILLLGTKRNCLPFLRFMGGADNHVTVGHVTV